MAKKSKQNNVYNPLAPAPTMHEALDDNPFRNLKLAGSEKKNSKPEKEEIKPTFKSFSQDTKKPEGKAKAKKGFGYVGGKTVGVAQSLGKDSMAIAHDDGEAFANAMGGVDAWTTDSLGVKRAKTNKKAPKGTLKGKKDKVQDAEPVMPMAELDSFKALETSLKKDAKHKNSLQLEGLATLSGEAHKLEEQNSSEPSIRPSVYVPSMAAQSQQPTKQAASVQNYSAQQRSRLAVENQRLQEAALFDEDGGIDEDMVFASALENMKDVKPLNAKGRQIHPEVEPVPAAQAGNDPVRDFLDGLIEFKLEFTTEYLEGHVVGLDPITIEKLRAGQYSPEAHLDLHGMNAEQAYEDLVRFFRRAYHQGLRTVLIIPGRGKNSPNGYGVLRERLQRWLTQDPFKRVTLAFCTAQLNDGGAGAVYVLLRKYKKSRGKIHWDRLPTDIDLF
ncbi:MAG: Smr/MutS family protein [Pseudomonadota bacterium]